MRLTAKQAAAEKHVVKLSDEERERLNALIHKGKHGARQAALPFSGAYQPSDAL